MVKLTACLPQPEEQARDVSLFSGGGYQFFKQGSQKILTLPLNTNKKDCDPPQVIGKKIVTLFPHFYSVIFF